MNLRKINKVFERFGKFQLRHSGAFIIGMLILTVIGFSGLSKLKISNDSESWFDDVDQFQMDTERFKNLFGTNDSVMVLVQAEDVFDPEVLLLIKELGDEIYEKVPYSRDIISIVHTPISIGTDEGFEVLNPFSEGIPDILTKEGKKSLLEKKKFILSRESLVNSIISEDATETWLMVSLDAYDTDVSVNDELIRVGNIARSVLEDPKWQNRGCSIKPAGQAYTKAEEASAIFSETKIRIISGLIAMILCLIFFLRTVRGVLFPLITTIGGIGMVFGFEGWLGIMPDQNLMTIPVMLGMALAVGYAIHYIYSFRTRFKKTGKRKNSVLHAVRESGWPIFFTAITTIASLLSFSAIKMPALTWAGLTSAATVFAVFIYVLFLMPVFLSFGSDKNPQKLEKTQYQVKIDSLFEKTGGKILTHKIPLMCGFLVLAAAFIPGIFRTKVNMDYFSMLGRKIPHINRCYEIMESQLGNMYSYDVMIEFDEEDALKNVDIINKIEKYTKRLGDLELTAVSNGKPRVTSVLDIVKELHRALNADNALYYTIPQDEGVLSQLLFFYEISGAENLQDWVTFDYSSARIHVELDRYDSVLIDKDLSNAQKIGEELFPSARVSEVGMVASYAVFNNRLVIGELKSFAISFIVILILLIVVFGSVKTGLIAMIPNVVPVIIVGGIMGYFNMPLDMISMMIVPLLLGISVDDTIHFTNQIKYQFELVPHYETAIKRSFHAIGKTLTTTTIILSSMFLMYVFSPLNMMFRIGLLTIIGLISALLADYILTPILIYLIKPFGKEETVK